MVQIIPFFSVFFVINPTITQKEKGVQNPNGQTPISKTIHDYVQTQNLLFQLKINLKRKIGIT